LVRAEIICHLACASKSSRCGEQADVVLMSVPVIDDLVQADALRPESAPHRRWLRRDGIIKGER